MTFGVQAQGGDIWKSAFPRVELRWPDELTSIGDRTLVPRISDGMNFDASLDPDNSQLEYLYIQPQESEAKIYLTVNVTGTPLAPYHFSSVGFYIPRYDDQATVVPLALADDNPGVGSIAPVDSFDDWDEPSLMQHYQEMHFRADVIQNRLKAPGETVGLEDIRTWYQLLQVADQLAGRYRMVIENDDMVDASLNRLSREFAIAPSAWDGGPCRKSGSIPSKLALKSRISIPNLLQLCTAVRNASAYAIRTLYNDIVAKLKSGGTGSGDCQAIETLFDRIQQKPALMDNLAYLLGITPLHPQTAIVECKADQFYKGVVTQSEFRAFLQTQIPRTEALERKLKLNQPIVEAAQAQVREMRKIERALPVD